MLELVSRLTMIGSGYETARRVKILLYISDRPIHATAGDFIETTTAQVTYFNLVEYGIRTFAFSQMLGLYFGTLT